MERLPDEIRERYVPVAELGRGAMGLVLRAVQKELDRPVAIKILQASAASTEALRARFLEEGRLAARVRHPNVVTVIGNGTTSDGHLYIVYELVEGNTLQKRLDESGLPPLRETLQTVRGILDGLEAIHAAGILHRDVKPANVVVQRDGTPRIIDFGIARDAIALERKTRTGEVLGTPDYLAPEVIAGERATAAADTYAVGVLLFRMVCGRMPFCGATFADVLQAHLQTAPPDPAAFRQGLPRPLRRLILEALEKKPADRPASARVFGRSLSSVSIDGPSGCEMTCLPPARPGSRQAPIATVVTTRTVPPDRRQRAPSLRAAALGALLVAIAAAAILGWPHRVRPVAAPTVRGAHAGPPPRLARIVLAPGELQARFSATREHGEEILTLSYPTPLRLPLRVRPPGAGDEVTPEVIGVRAVAEELLKTLDRLPGAIRSFPGRSELASLGRRTDDSPRREALAKLLARGDLLEIWQILASHAAPLLESDLPLSTKSQILDAIALFEDVSVVLRLAHLPVPVDLEPARPASWGVSVVTTVTTGVVLPFSALASPASELDTMGFVSEFQPSLGSSGAPSWRKACRIRAQSRIEDFPARLEKSFTATLRMAVDPGQTSAWIAVPFQRGWYWKCTLRVRLGGRLTLRLSDDGAILAPGKSTDERWVVHRFDARALDPGTTRLEFNAVSHEEKVHFDYVEVAEVRVGVGEPPTGRGP